MQFRLSSSRKLGLAAACTTALCWSFLAILIKFAFQFGDAYTIVWYRMATAFSCYSIYLLTTRQTQHFKVFIEKPGLLTLAGICLIFNYLGFTLSIELTSPANSQVFIQMGPLMLALSGIIFFDEKLSQQQKWGLLCCALGFSFFFYDKLYQEPDDGSSSYLLGQFWILFAAVTWAIFAVLQKKILTLKSSHEVNLYIFGLASLAYLPGVQWSSLETTSFLGHGLFFFLGINTLIAYGCLSLALKHLPATQVSPILTLNPLLTLVFLILLEKLQWNIIPPDPISTIGYLGACLAVFGTLVVLKK